MVARPFHTLGHCQVLPSLLFLETLQKALRQKSEGMPVVGLEDPNRYLASRPRNLWSAVLLQASFGNRVR